MKSRFKLPSQMQKEAATQAQRTVPATTSQNDIYQVVYYGFIYAPYVFSSANVDRPQTKEALALMSKVISKNWKKSQTDPVAYENLVMMLHQMKEVMQEVDADRMTLPHTWLTEEGEPGPGQIVLKAVLDENIPIWLTFNQRRYQDGKHVVWQLGANLPSLTHESDQIVEKELYTQLMAIDTALGDEETLDPRPIFDALDKLCQENGILRVRLNTKSNTPEAARIRKHLAASPPKTRVHFNHHHPDA